jgi:hypothetical protein
MLNVKAYVFIFCFRIEECNFSFFRCRERKKNRTMKVVYSRSSSCRKEWMLIQKKKFYESVSNGEKKKKKKKKKKELRISSSIHRKQESGVLFSLFSNAILFLFFFDWRA